MRRVAIPLAVVLVVVSVVAFVTPASADPQAETQPGAVSACPGDGSEPGGLGFPNRARRDTTSWHSFDNSHCHVWTKWFEQFSGQAQPYAKLPSRDIDQVWVDPEDAGSAGSVPGGGAPHCYRVYVHYTPYTPGTPGTNGGTPGALAIAIDVVQGGGTFTDARGDGYYRRPIDETASGWDMLWRPALVSGSLDGARYTEHARDSGDIALLAGTWGSAAWGAALTAPGKMPPGVASVSVPTAAAVAYGANSEAQARYEGCRSLHTPGAPLTVTGLAVVGAGDRYLDLAWDALAGATAYHVKRSLTAGGPYAAVGMAPSTSFTDTTVVNGSTYYYVVTADVSGSETLPSAEVSATPRMPDYAAFGHDPNGAYSPDPVNLASGNFTTHADDLMLPGRVIPFTLTRWYNSADATVSPLGPGWTHSYAWTLTDSGARIDVRRGTGRRDTFIRLTDGTYEAPPGVFDLLTKNTDGTYTLTLTTQEAYEFAADGRLARIHEPAGNQLSFTYTGGLLTGANDTAGRQVSFLYDPSGRLTQLQDPLGRRVSYGYDAAGRLTLVVDKIGNAPGQDPALHTWSYAYEGTTSHLASISDPEGRVRVRNTYDPQGRVVEQRDALDHLTAIAYGAGGTTLTGPRGHVSTYTFDERMRVLTRTDVLDGQGYTLSYTYDAAGDRTSVTDRRGDTTDLTYDARGNVLTKTDPAPASGEPRPLTTFEYDARNHLTRIVDPLGRETALDYDPVTGTLQSVSRQVGASVYAVTRYDYVDTANPGLPTRITSPRGNTGPAPDPAFATILAYDAQGNLASRTDPDGATTTYAYDAAGRLASFVDPDGSARGAVPAEHTWSIAYDENDNEVARTDPLGASARYGYDATGLRLAYVDRNGNMTLYGYDGNGRLVSVVQEPEPGGTEQYTTTVARDANGNATRITHGNGVATDYAFDELDRPISVTTHPTPSTALVTSYILDGNGQPTSRTTGDGVAVTYAYDALSRLTAVSGPGLSVTYGYDALGHRTAMSDATGTTTYEDDGLGRVTRIAAPNGTLGYAYDLDGDRTSLGYPGGDTVSYAYSPGGRLSSVTDWAGRTSAYTYTPSGLVSRLDLPNGVRATYGYDRAQRLTDLAYTSLGGELRLFGQRFTLDAEGDRTALEETSLAQPSPPTLAVDRFAMTYDGLLRLTALDGALFGGGTSSETFSYDAATNLTARTGPAATYATDGANRVTSDGLRAFAWDGADRLIQRGADSFAYDALSRLTSSTVAGTTRSYAYDGDGLLAGRTEGQATTAFLWDTSVSPAPLVAAGADRVVQGLGPLYLAHPGGTTTTLIRDALGSVRAEANDLGVVTKAFRYAAYGEVVQPNPATPTLLGFAGELADPSGLIYLRARWYDPGLGRQITRDSIDGDARAAPASLNLYAYALGSPTKFTDPSGNCPLCVIVLANPVTRGAITGAVSYTVGYFASRLATGRSANDFDLRGLALAAGAGAVTGGFGAGVPTAGRVLLGAGVSAAVEETTQLADNSFGPERLLVSTAFGAFSGMFRAEAFPALIGFNVLLQTDKRLSRELIAPPSRSTGLLPLAPVTEPPQVPQVLGK